jgi:membrane-associated protease RseP (regulator of RpoE activity)
MADAPPPGTGPSADEFAGAFDVYERRRNGDRLLYFGQPRAPRDAVLRQVWPLFRERGYQVTLTRRRGEDVLVAEPVDTGVDGVPWTNVLLFVATLLSTLYAGSMWYYVRDPLANPLSVLQAWPFAAAVLGVLGIHELGHYAMSRYHDVDATLPYFIPMPTFIGTMGAVIRMKGQMPDRKALFDIGVAGPIAGLVATVVVTAIGLAMPPIDVPAWVYASPNTFEVEFGKPLLFHGIAAAMGVEPTYRNPVVIGGWVGMFVTFLNLLPVGQLDGGHVVRALVGDRQRTVAALVPGVLFALAGYLYYVEQVGDAVWLWGFWGVLAMVFAFVGPAQPIHEEGLDGRRKLVGVMTLVVGLLCFTPVPIQIVP